MNIYKEKILHYLKIFFGKRTLKTAFATALALSVAKLLNLNSPIMAGISAIITMKSSIFDSSKQSINRMLATVLGVLIASLFQLLNFSGFIPTMLGIIILINICNFFKWKDAISLSTVVFVIVMLHSPDHKLTYWEYGMNRLLDTSVGLLIGFLVNYIIFPPNREEFIFKTYQQSLVEIETAILNLLSGGEANLDKLIEEINALNNELNYLIKDNQLGGKHKIKTSQLTRVNSMFYSAIAIITLFNEDGIVPIIADYNKRRLNEYFGYELKLDSNNCSEEFESAFNYYLDELLKLMENIKTKLLAFEDIILAKKDEASI